MAMADATDMKPMAKEDIRAGLTVQYHTNDGKWIESEIEDTTIFIHDGGQCVRLVAKHRARLSRIYVSNRLLMSVHSDGEAGAAIGANQAAEAANLLAPEEEADDPQTFVTAGYMPWLLALIDKCASEGQKLPAGLLSAITDK